MIRKIGILTSGGDAPGMNAAISAVARIANARGIEVVGIKRGYNGVLNENLAQDVEVLSLETILDIANQGGTYLRTARCEAFKQHEVRVKAAENIKTLGIDALVVIGGDGSFHGAMYLSELGIPCVCIPGTIDNDIAYTEETLGYDTAVNTCVQAVRQVRDTSRSHDRVGVVEVMGRHCGDIGLKTAMATGADMLIVPEVEWSIEEVAARLTKLYAGGNTRVTLVISEHSWEKGNLKPYDWKKVLKDNGKKVHDDDEMSAGYLATVLELMCKKQPGCEGMEVRATVVAYPQRGGAPTAQDATFAFKAAQRAVELLCDGKTNLAIGIRDGRIFDMPLCEVLDIQKKKTNASFDKATYDLINSL